MKYTIRLGKDKNGIVANLSAGNVDMDGSVRVGASTPVELGIKVGELLDQHDANPKWEVKIDPDTQGRLMGGEREFLNILDRNTH